MRPQVEKILRSQYESLCVCPSVPYETVVDRMMKALLRTRNIVFIKVPTVDAPLWPEHVKKQFFRCIAEARHWKHCGPEKDWIYLELEGTTFSGHATRTTLGNTLRSLCYAYWYCTEAGITDTPWDSDKLLVIAAGDDVVIWVQPQYMQLLVDTILMHTTRDITYQQVGLGQCVKEVDFGDFWQVAFCSKWSLTIDGTIGTWIMIRDVSKILTRKQYFTGRNAHLLQHPRLHREAIYEGFKHERVSQLIEDILMMMIRQFDDVSLSSEEKTRLIRDYAGVRYAQDPADYAAEAFVNRIMGVEIGTLYNLCINPVIYAGGKRR